jgi:hypothetical protein
MWELIIGFLWHLLSGEAYTLWKQHKLNEAISAQNKDASLADDAAIKRLSEDYTRK